MVALTVQLFAQLECLLLPIRASRSRHTPELAQRYTELLTHHPTAFPHVTQLVLDASSMVDVVKFDTVLTTAWVRDMARAMPLLETLHIHYVEDQHTHREFERLFQEQRASTSTPVFANLRTLKLYKSCSPLQLLLAAPFAPHITAVDISSCVPFRVRDLAAVCGACPALVSLDITLATEEQVEAMEKQQQGRKTRSDDAETKKRFTQEHDDMARKLYPKLSHVLSVSCA